MNPNVVLNNPEKSEYDRGMERKGLRSEMGL